MMANRKKKDVYFRENANVSMFSFSLEELKQDMFQFAAKAGVSISEVKMHVSYETGYYDSVDMKMEYSVTRKETDDEYTAAVANERAIARRKAATWRANEEARKIQREAAEKAEYERLKAKFG